MGVTGPEGATVTGLLVIVDVGVNETRLGNAVLAVTGTEAVGAISEPN
jgi:hypothetical protein